MKKIILTGGGTAGHVTPNLALLPSLKEAGYEIRYIGSYQGMERKLIETAGIPYDGISSGCQTLQNSCHHTRIRYDAWPGQ